MQPWLDLSKGDEKVEIKEEAAPAGDFVVEGAMDTDQAEAPTAQITLSLRRLPVTMPWVVAIPPRLDLSPPSPLAP